MRLPRTFQGLCALRGEARSDLSRTLARRMAREEWPLVPALRDRLRDAGCDPDRARPRERWEKLTPAPLRALERGPAKRHWPTPDPLRIRRHWALTRKLGLILARGQGGALLRRGYVPAHLDPSCEGTGLTIASTEHDEELLQEQARRAWSLLDVKEEAIRLHPAATLGGAPARALSAISRAHSVSPEQRLIVTDEDLLEDALQGGWREEQCLLLEPWGGPWEPVNVPRLRYFDVARLFLLHVPGEPGPFWYDDLAWVEDGGVVTSLAHHGTLLARHCVPSLEGATLSPASRSAANGLPRLVLP